MLTPTSSEVASRDLPGLGGTTAKTFFITTAVFVVAIMVDFATDGELFGWLALSLVGLCLFAGCVLILKDHSRRFGVGLILGAVGTLLVYGGVVAWAMTSGLLAG